MPLRRLVPLETALSWLVLSFALLMAGCDNSVPAPGPAPAQGVQGMNPGGPPGMAMQQPAIDETGPFAAGKKVFAANGCGRCHRMAGGPGGPQMAQGFGGPPPGAPGPGGPPEGAPGAGGPPPGGPGGPPGGPGQGGPGPGGPRGGRAPDLSKIGADPEHTVEWLMDFVRNPKAINPDAKMPAFGDRINDNDLRALAEYLASLKE